MAKATPITAADMVPAKSNPQSAGRPRGAIPSADLTPLQFRMPPEFVKEFKQAALDADCKMNELLVRCFQAYRDAG